MSSDTVDFVSLAEFSSQANHSWKPSLDVGLGVLMVFVVDFWVCEGRVVLLCLHPCHLMWLSAPCGTPGEPEQPLCTGVTHHCSQTWARRGAGRMLWVIEVLFLPSPTTCKAPSGISSQKNALLKNINQTWPGFVVVRAYSFVSVFNLFFVKLKICFI